MNFRIVLLLIFFTSLSLHGADNITQHGIKWSFDKDYKTGKFANGDYWVLGPVTIVGITTDLHAQGFTPGPDDDGSMLNPGGTEKQGYDGSLNSYRKELNAALINGKRVAPDNPLVLKPGSSLVSMVSWLYRSETDAEPGIPGFNGQTKAPRPVTRSGAVLTVLSSPPPDGSFRPPYCGNDKTVKFNIKNIDTSRLKNLEPVQNTPDPAQLVKELNKPWIDNVHEFLGAMVHPSENMPNYGREMGKIICEAALLLNLDFTKLPGQPKKDELLIRFIQLGIDFAGIADAGGGWPANGGHGPGRKLPILMAGVLLKDDHMMKVGEWKTRFHDDEQTFYVTKDSVEITNSKKWNPDSRAKDKEPYEAKDIGMPEWGIRHAKEPETDNRGWNTPYRDINASVIPGMALAASIMGLRNDWKHEAYFDYAVRSMDENQKRGIRKGTNTPNPFVMKMWEKYSSQFGLVPKGK